MIHLNLRAIIIYEIIYKIFSSILFLSICLLLFKLCLFITGEDYLSTAGERAFFLHPAFYVMCVLIFLVYAFLMLIDAYGLIGAINAARLGDPLRVSQIFFIAFSKAKTTARLHNLGMILLYGFVLIPSIIIPFVGISNIIKFPSFITDFLVKRPLLIGIILAAIVVICISASTKIFSVNFFALRRGRFDDAIDWGGVIIHKLSFKVLWGIFWRFVALGLVFLLVMLALTLMEIIICGLLIPVSDHYPVVLNTIDVSMVILFVVIGQIMPIFGIYWSLRYYYACCVAKKINPCGEKPKKYKRLRPASGLIFATFVAAVFCIAVIVSLLSPDYLKSFDYKAVNVIAHRGDSAYFPENTTLSINSALDKNIKYIEIDVRQTKDGVPVLLHDRNLSRVTGYNYVLDDLTYNEIRNMDVGSWFDERFYYARIPTLDEVLKLCKGKANLQIELKPSENYINFEENVVNIIRENGFEKDCVVGSFSEECLEKIHSLAPEINTLYILSLADERLISHDFAGDYSIEQRNMTRHLANHIHEMGKSCYVWTVDEPEDIQSLSEMEIDGIVTNDPSKTSETLFGRGKNPLALWLVRLLYG